MRRARSGTIPQIHTHTQESKWGQMVARKLYAHAPEIHKYRPEKTIHPNADATAWLTSLARWLLVHSHVNQLSTLAAKTTGRSEPNQMGIQMMLSVVRLQVASLIVIHK